MKVHSICTNLFLKDNFKYVSFFTAHSSKYGRVSEMRQEFVCMLEVEH